MRESCPEYLLLPPATSSTVSSLGMVFRICIFCYFNLDIQTFHISKQFRKFAWAPFCIFLNLKVDNLGTVLSSCSSCLEATCLPPNQKAIALARKEISAYFALTRSFYTERVASWIVFLQAVNQFKSRISFCCCCLSGCLECSCNVCLILRDIRRKHVVLIELNGTLKEFLLHCRPMERTVATLN